MNRLGIILNYFKMSNENFQYNYALVCNNLPNSVLNGQSIEEHDPINLETARNDHQMYLNYLRECGLKLIEINPDENFPDCVFVEDVAIAVKNRVFLGNLSSKTRYKYFF